MKGVVQLPITARENMAEIEKEWLDDEDIKDESKSDDDLFDPESQVAKIDTNADIVFCIDGTGSMSPIISEIKNNALSFHDKLRKALEEKNRKVKQIRIKVIVFRDIYVDTKAFTESEFFILPDQEKQYSDFVNSIVATGGGDEPESSLEALTKAMASDWVSEGQRRRHIIVMFTDASAHPLDKSERYSSDQYPDEMPKDLIELEELWMGSEQSGSMDQNAKRLAIFAPDAYPWNDIGNEWDLATHVASKAGAGCSEAETQIVISFIANSI